MAKTVLHDRVKWETLPEVKTLKVLDLELVTKNLRSFFAEWQQDGPDLAEVEVNLLLVTVDILRGVFLMNDEEIQAALGEELYQAARVMVETPTDELFEG